MRSAVAPLLLVLATACGGEQPADGAAAPAGAPSASMGAPSDGEADKQELSDYVLTMEDVRKWGEANRIASKMKIAEQQRDDDADDDGSIEGMEARIGANPQARAAIEQAGLEVRDYVVITWTMLQAGMAQYAVEQGADADSVAAKTGVNPANLEFVREHRQELEQLQKEVQESAAK